VLNLIECAVAQLLGRVEEAGIALLDLTYAPDQRPDVAPAPIQPGNVQGCRQIEAVEQCAQVVAQPGACGGRVALGRCAPVLWVRSGQQPECQHLFDPQINGVRGEVLDSV